MAKSVIYGSKGVQMGKRDKIKQVPRLNFTNDIGKYLGFKIFHGRVTKEDFNGILDRVNSKLASWKSRLFISLAELFLVMQCYVSYQLMECTIIGSLNLFVINLTCLLEISFGRATQIEVFACLGGRRLQHREEREDWGFVLLDPRILLC